MHTHLSRRLLFKASLAATGSAAAAAVLAACGDAVSTVTTVPTVSVAPTAVATMPAPTTAPVATTLPASATAPAMPSAGATAAPTAIPVPATLPATTGTGATSAPTVQIAMAGGGKTVPELRIAVPLLPAGIDPQESWGIAWYRVFSLAYDTLLKIDYLNGNKLAPSLATEWKRTDDRTLEVTLRRDVLWQDGSPFSAADVKYTFDRVMSGDPKLQAARPTYFPLTSVDVLDDYRVRFVTPAVDALLEKRLAAPGSQIVPAKYHKMVGVDGFRTRPIGTGPYRLVEFARDDHFTFEAHDRYFGGAPAAKKVTVRAIPEVATRIAAVLNNEVDLITDVPPDQVPIIAARSGLTIRGVQGVNASMLMFNGLRKPTDNKFVRQALALAIDRKTLTEQLWNGNAVHPRGLQFDGDEFFNPERPLIPYDPAKAKALLAQGGYAGEPITYVHSAPNYYILEHENAEAIVGMWKQIGVNARSEGIEFAQWSAQFANADSPYHALSTSQSSEIGDPNTYLYQGYGPGTTLQTKKSDPTLWAQYNMLGQQALTTLDKTRRATAYQQMLDIWDDLTGATSLLIPKLNYAIRNTFEWTPYPLQYLDLRAYNFKVK